MIESTPKTCLRGAGQVLMAVAVLVLLSGCERWALDRQMEELCKKDGGITVYETVTLPASDFNEFGEPLGRYIQTAKTREDYFGPDYRYVTKEKYISGNSQTKVEHGEGTLVRRYQAIYRRSDQKLLVEAVNYHRAGGDEITLGFHFSQEVCPRPSPNVSTIFIKGG